MKIKLLIFILFLYRNLLDNYDNNIKYINSINLEEICKNMTYGNNTLYYSKNNIVYEKGNNKLIELEDNIVSLNYNKFIYILTDKKIYKLENKLVEEYADILLTLPSDYILQSIAFYKNDTYIIYKSNKIIYILAIADNKIIKKYKIEENISIHNSYFYKNRLYLLVTLNNINYIYIIGMKKDNSNNFLNLIKCLCHNNKYNIMDSVALIEKSLAQILESESYKIKKIVCISSNIDDIIEVNNSVNNLIKNIIMLEQILCAKLEIYEKIMHNKNKLCKKND